MKITLNNYEEYIIDYIEGNLSKELQAEMELFISVYPNIQSELIDLGEYHLKPEISYFGNKDLLKKENLDFKNDNQLFTEFCVAKLENDLTQEDLAEFTNFLHSNPHKNFEYSLYEKTKLKIEAIQFPAKKKLKKNKFQLIKTKYIIYSAAAIIILGLISPVILQKIFPEYITKQLSQDSMNSREENMNSYIITSSEIMIYSPHFNVIKDHKDILASLATLPMKKNVVQKDINMKKRDNDISSPYDTVSGIATINPTQHSNILFDSISTNNNCSREKHIEDTINVANELNTEHYLTLKQHIAQRVSEKIHVDLRKPPSIKNTHFIKIVQAGIKGYNSIFNKDVVIKQAFGKDGKRKMLAIKTDKFQIIKYY